MSGRDPKQFHRQGSTQANERAAGQLKGASQSVAVPGKRTLVEGWEAQIAIAQEAVQHEYSSAVVAVQPMTAGDLARLWDKQYRDTTALLDVWVAAEPHPVKTISATAVQSMMDCGALLVDVLKMGEGASQGGWGWAEDVIRLASVLPALGRIRSLQRVLRSLHYRPSGNRGALMSRNGLLHEVRRLFYDNVTSKWARARYWRAGSGGAQGRALHHWLFADRWKLVPNGIRQAGFNLMEISSTFNSRMGATPWREIAELGFRAAVIIAAVAEEWLVQIATTHVVEEHRRPGEPRGDAWEPERKPREHGGSSSSQ